MDHTPEQVERMLAAAARAQAEWRLLPVEGRAEHLDRLGEMLLARSDALAAHVTLEMGKTIAEARAEVEKCAAHCKWYAEHGPAMLRERPAVVGSGQAVVAQRAIGLVLGTMPWNFPFWQVVRAAVPIMLAGNGFVLKHARNAMRFAFDLEAACLDSGLPPGVFSVLNIDQVTTSSVLADPRIVAVTLTGSARAGAAVAAQAGALLKKSVLELGGSDPFVVLEDADVARAAAMGVRARFQNAGQVCIAAKRFIVAAPVAEAFTEEFLRLARALRTGDPMDPATDMGRMACPDLRDELHGQVTASVRANATVLLGGERLDGSGNFYAPTVLTGVKPGMRVFDEETFGPCAAITVADDAAEALALANLSQFGLSASIWTADSQRADEFTKHFECGGVFVNGFPTSDPRVPIGGVKRSGYGRELSHSASPSSPTSRPCGATACEPVRLSKRQPSPLEALRWWKARRNDLKPLPPRVVSEAPWLENTRVGDELDVSLYPAPHWHRHDGGRYIGSGSLIVTRDPDTGWINASIYRVQVHGPNRVTVQFDHTGRHGSMIAKKYWDRGVPCPVAIVNGQDPALFIAGFEYLPEGASELEFAGAIKGFPVDVVEGPRTGLPIPVSAEIVLEGQLLPLATESLSEGPFGEFTGYYAADAKPAPVMAVKASYHRNDPILFGSPPLKPPRFHFGLPFRAATLWSGLEQLGVTDVCGVWQHVSQLMTVVALRQRYAGHAKRAALIAAANSYMGRIVVVVDEDIDPSDLADVMWAVTTRAEPSEQVDIIRDAWSSGLDPRIPLDAKQRGKTSHSKMIIDACRPFDQRESYPRTTSLSLEERDATIARWGHAFLK